MRSTQVTAGLLLAMMVISCVGKPLQAQEIDAVFPQIYNSEAKDAGEPLSPLEALNSLRLPAGFSATLFSQEPDVQNPIAAAIDARGRVWIAENYTYAERSERFDLSLRDRVVVLEDSDGDGVSDKRTVFTDRVQMLTGITVGQGGVWLMCPPQLLFVPDADGDLVPDGPPEVKLDGFTVARENYHNFANGLSWGPDSWLYGRCGASCAGQMGLPGCLDEDRVPIRGGMWRFHPQRQVVEALTQGTTNPWGHDWNDVGELFYINTVNGHLWHSIPGAHFVRAHTIDANPFTYELIDTHADHWHFDTGKSWTDSRDGAANDFGGGHAHIGAMIYQGAAWPEKFNGRLMTVNMHGRRVNVERLEQTGSGYVARHEDDFVLSDDTWFRGMELLPTPDGNALLIDWSDTGECHEATGVHRTSGRVFKIVYGESVTRAAQPAASIFAGDMASDPAILAAWAVNGTEWEVRRARELLRTKWINNQDNPQMEIARSQLTESMRSGKTSVARVRSLLALNAIDGLSVEQLTSMLSDESPNMRTWAIRLLSDTWPIDRGDGTRPISNGPTEPSPATIQRLAWLAVVESSASVRLTLASTLQRLPVNQRGDLAAALMTHATDADDHNLPLMVWYGIMPLAHGHMSILVDLFAASTWPTTRRLIARRVAEQIDDQPAEIARMVALADSSAKSADVGSVNDLVQGFSQGLAGRRKLTQPEGWRDLQDTLNSVDLGDHAKSVKRAVGDLNVLFGDGVAIDELKRISADGKASLEARKAALQSLVSSKADGLREICTKMLKQRFLNIVALQGLAAETDPVVGQEILAAFRSFAPLDRPQVISILATRKPWAATLLKAVDDGQIDRSEISSFQARQIVSLNEPELEQSLARLWGKVRETPAERQQQISSLKEQLTPTSLAAADPKLGRALFDKNCSSCHTLFGQGGKLGPDLTGAQRSNLDYLLENIIDPSAVVTKEFRATILLLEDGRVLTGLLVSQTEAIVTLATQNETFRIATEEIAKINQSESSTMPDGLLSQMTTEQIRNLFAYLQASKQSELPQ